MEKIILVIEDDTMISDIIVYNLKKEGYKTLKAVDGETGLRLAETEKIDLILLDVMLPGMNGRTVCRRIRAFSDVPIIMVTARESEEDKVEGLELGADDYITKPFQIRELISRVRAQLRRASGELNVTCRIGALLIDGKRRVATLNEKPLDISAREYELLRFLASEPDTVYTREEIVTRVFEYEAGGGTRVVDVAISRLREKMAECMDGGDKIIATKHGIGYYFQSDTLCTNSDSASEIR